MPFELTVHRCVTLGALLNLSEQKLCYTGYKVWKIVTIVTKIKETMHVRVSRTGAGSEQVLKIVVFKKVISDFYDIVSHYCGNGLIYLFLCLSVLTVLYPSQHLALSSFLNFSCLVVKLHFIVILTFLSLITC